MLEMLEMQALMKPSARSQRHTRSATCHYRPPQNILQPTQTRPLCTTDTAVAAGHFLIAFVYDYQVLRDASRRSSYDSLRRGLGGIGSQGPYSSSNWRPGADDFEEAFASWFERQG